MGRVTITVRRDQYARRFLGSDADTCNVSRMEEGQYSAYGGETGRYEQVYTSEPCRVQRSGRAQRGEEAMQGMAQTEWEIVLGYSVEIAYGDRIDVDGQLFEVQGTNEGQTDRLFTLAYCNRRDRQQG